MFIGGLFLIVCSIGLLFIILYCVIKYNIDTSIKENIDKRIHKCLIKDIDKSIKENIDKSIHQYLIQFPTIYGYELIIYSNGKKYIIIH